jgi:hypothetical protein
MISEKQAIIAAQKSLKDLQITYEDRNIDVSLQQVYTVLFRPPSRMRAGVFTLVIDSDTGKLIAMQIER